MGARKHFPSAHSCRVSGREMQLFSDEDAGEETHTSHSVYWHTSEPFRREEAEAVTLRQTSE